MALKEVEMGDLSLEERELLLTLVRQIYDLLEVRYYVSGEPPFGECQMDATRHTRAPQM
jgi:hypothetical protein